MEKVRLHLEDEERGARRQVREESMITVEEIMETDVIAVPPSLRLEDLARLFVEKRVSGFPVVDSRGELLGLVSQKDLLASVLEESSVTPSADFYSSLYSDFEELGLLPGGRVQDIMTPFVYFATLDTDIREVIDLMLTKNIHRVVVTEQGLLQGLVTTACLLKVLQQIL